MQIKCPNCGAVHSLDSLLTEEAGSELMLLLANMPPALANNALRYIGLFRPPKSKLSFARVAKLLNELAPMISKCEAVRDGKYIAAPEAAWLHGFEMCLQAREQGRLKTPLKSHGYLLEIVSAYQSEANAVAPQTARPAPVKPPSQTLTAAAALQGAKR